MQCQEMSGWSPEEVREEPVIPLLSVGVEYSVQVILAECLGGGTACRISTRSRSRDRRSIERLDPNLGVDDMSHALHTLQPLQGSEQGPHRLSTCLGGMRGGGGASDGGPT